MRRSVVMLVLALSAVAPAAADNTSFGDEIVVAVLDTGLRATHAEFDYRGPEETGDQIVAWWDFTDTAGPARGPGPGQLWDDRIADPYDDHGHGTATASLAVGRNVAPAATKSPSFAPGAKLAVARVCDRTGSCPGDIAGAIRWATDDVGADVISISIGAIIPAPMLISSVHAAAGEARDSGVLVVVANGNGTGNAAGPNPGWAQPHGASPEVLSVGAADVWGFVVTTDPEVVARYDLVPVATNSCDICYARMSGTSFATPLVAGMAAAAMREAVAAGADASPGRIETLLKFGARDTAVPPSQEGYGVLDGAQVPSILAHAAAGTLPARPDPDVNALYVDSLGANLRGTWTDNTGPGVIAFEPTPIPVTNRSGLLGTSVAPGLSEGEAYTVTLEAGQTLSASVSAQYEFFDLHLYRGDGPSFGGHDLVRNAGYGSPALRFRSREGGTYTILVSGFSVLFDLPFTIAANIDGAPVPVSLASQRYYATTSNYLIR